MQAQPSPTIWRLPDNATIESYGGGLLLTYHQPGNGSGEALFMGLKPGWLNDPEEKDDLRRAVDTFRAAIIAGSADMDLAVHADSVSL